MPRDWRTIARHFRFLGSGRCAEPTGDGTLLTRFLTERDESAFAELVRRHGPMVLGVCRRFLGHAEDSEDAFQAAFLVLAMKAAAVRPRESVGGWLYGVAVRTARKARHLRERRRRKEAPLAPGVEPPAPTPAAPADWLPLLERVVDGLPLKYRMVVRACDLQGRSRADAARELGVPEGTLSSRLARARRMVRKRMERAGVGLAALVPAAWVERTARAAGRLAAGTKTVNNEPGVVLAKGVIQAMTLTRIKLIGVVGFVLALLGGGVGAWALRPATAEPHEDPEAATEQLARAEKPPADDSGDIEGTWQVIGISVGGSGLNPPGAKTRWHITADSVTVIADDQDSEFKCRFDDKESPKKLRMMATADPTRQFLGVARVRDGLLYVAINVVPGDDGGGPPPGPGRSRRGGGVGAPNSGGMIPGPGTGAPGMGRMSGGGPGGGRMGGPGAMGPSGPPGAGMGMPGGFGPGGGWNSGVIGGVSIPMAAESDYPKDFDPATCSYMAVFKQVRGQSLKAERQLREIERREQALRFAESQLEQLENGLDLLRAKVDLARAVRDTAKRDLDALIRPARGRTPTK
jgi:RNA polymerase sigma factor (sigma-70 family)